MKPKVKIVVGLGFGDEGKGRVVSSLAAQNPNAMVVRYNGGHQAGHTVWKDGKKHVFSHFSAGTLHGLPTLWSKNCTVSPVTLMNEYWSLKKNFDIEPQIYFSKSSPVSTMYDLWANRQDKANLKDGSCGVGFGKTLLRHKEVPIYFSDLSYENVFKEKLKSVEAYYKKRGMDFGFAPFKEASDKIKDAKEGYLKAVEDLKKFLLKPERPLLGESMIFEGAQGTLLDKRFGFYPNVTPSNTTIRNAMDLIDALGKDNFDIEVYYVTRAYSTRHGNGYFPHLENLKLKNNENETNVLNEYQGDFRIGRLSTELLNYARGCNMIFSKGIKTKLCVTCLDQTDGKMKMVNGGEKVDIMPEEFFNLLPEWEEVRDIVKFESIG